SSKETFSSTVQSFNPDISAIVDLFYHTENSGEGLGHILGEMSGFGHAHGHGDEGHGHAHGPEKGFNLRHLELQISAAVDPYFKGSAIAAIDLHGAEMETAEIETTGLPWGLKLRGGKFFSDFGYINAQHAHSWDFSDQPLIYKLGLGDHGLNDKGLQLSWLAPTPFYLLVGLEAFQGGNETLFAYHGDGPLPTHDGPRVRVGWLKFGPNLSGNHALQFGVFAATGKHQEEHDGNGDGEDDHWLDGDGSFWGGDVVYKYNAPKPHGQGDVIVQAEYFSRRKDLKLVAHDLAPHFVGNRRVDEQDGYYAQVVYGFLPRWRAGVRWDQVGLTNETKWPSGETETFGSSDRASLMLDFTPSEFSRIRLQANRGSYQTEEGREDVVEFYVQWMISLGAHGAHKF
ncbi:MAG: hypothetical protein U1E27_12435, partial [Kiritimatiellia bacterium]|nr:hypothetical protein [Kiritimatiellia bacterium]